MRLGINKLFGNGRPPNVPKQLTAAELVDRWQKLTQESGNDPFDQQWKLQKVVPHISAFAADGRLGTRWLDIGSGREALSWHIDDARDQHGTRVPHRIVSVDQLKIQNTHPTGYTHAEFDIHAIDSFQEHVLEPHRDYLNLTTETSLENSIDTMFFFDILNYIDAGNTLAELARFLKPGGYFVILNGAERHAGVPDLLHPHGAKGSRDIHDALKKAGFEIEKIVGADKLGGRADMTDSGHELIFAHKHQ